MKKHECCICGKLDVGNKTKDGKFICRQCAFSSVSGTNKTIMIRLHSSQDFKEMINRNKNKDYDFGTAKGMYEYTVLKGMSNGITENFGLKHFGQIYLALINDEKVEYPFICKAEDNGNMACAITNKRVIFAKKKLMSTFTNAIYLDKINKVSLDSGQLIGKIKMTFNNDIIVFGMPKNKAQEIYQLLNEKIHDHTKTTDLVNSLENVKKSKISYNKFDEIREYKKLFDEGVIDEEQFEQVKKELLDI